MKMAITVTAVYDFHDDVELEDIVEGEDSLGRHIVVKGHKLQPVIDFLEYDGQEGDSHSWEEADEEEMDEAVYDCLVSEEYTIIEIDGIGED